MKILSLAVYFPLCVAAGACSSDSGGIDSATDAGADAGIGPAIDAGAADAGPDLTGEMFVPDHVINIEIELDPQDWDELRVQARSFFDVLGANCLEEPPPRPFTYFPATVRIDGEQVSNVGVRKKGFFGSLSDTKPSLKIKFSEYVPEQRFSGLKRMTLNNNKSDAAHVKQCIGYALFTKAGVPAPRCSFATVTVNGVNLGIFTHVESIKKPFIARHFADKEGNLYEGALSDFRPGWVETFQRKTNKPNEALGEVADRSDIEALVPALAVDDSELLNRIDALVEVESFFDLWVMETIMMHADGYARNTNNFYMYNDPQTGKFTFIPWGIDSILFGNQTLPWEAIRAPESIFAEGVLSRRLYLHPATRQRYLERMDYHLEITWDADEILSEVDRMQALLTPYLLEGERATFDQSIGKVTSFVASRHTQLRAELDAAEPVSWTSELREPWCLGDLGTVDATFTGQWTDDISTTNPFADGTLTINSTVPGGLADGLRGGTTLGVNPDDGKNVLRLVSFLERASDPQTEASVALIVIIALADEELVPQSLVVDYEDHAPNVIRMVFPPGGADPEFEALGVVGDGVLDLDAIGSNPGDPLRGSVELNVYELPF